MDTHYELGYDTKTLEGDLQKAISQTKGAKSIKVLLCHESFPPFEDALPKDIIAKAKEAFDWINMHLGEIGELERKRETIEIVYAASVISGEVLREVFEKQTLLL